MELLTILNDNNSKYVNIGSTQSLFFKVYSAVVSLIDGQTKDAYLFLAFTFIAGLMIALNSRRAKLYRDKMRKEQERQKQ